MPYPQNLELAQELESILRNKGVTPATIGESKKNTYFLSTVIFCLPCWNLILRTTAIKDGFCRVGLSKDELEDLAVSGEENRAKKCSTRDLPVLIAKHRASESKDQWGATTVASSMRLAHLAGIETFVTGGIGGVHRDGQNTMDVSLVHLSQWSWLSYIKAILNTCITGFCRLDRASAHSCRCCFSWRQEYIGHRGTNHAMLQPRGSLFTNRNSHIRLLKTENAGSLGDKRCSCVWLADGRIPSIFLARIWSSLPISCGECDRDCRSLFSIPSP